MPVAIGTILFVDLLLLFVKTGNTAVAGVMSFAVSIILVVVLHEFGHFVTAKAFRIKVTEFFVGFGPRLWSIKRGETEYGVKAIPAGGYVRIAGMNPFTEEPPEDRERTFGAKPGWQRLIVLVAGVAMHFVLAFVLLTGYYGAVGTPVYGVAVGQVEAKLDGKPSPAARAGLKPGDVIVSVDGRSLTSDEFIDYTRAHVGEPVTLVVSRDGQTLSFTMTPVLSEVEGHTVGRFGVALSPGPVIRRDRQPIGGAVVSAGRFIRSGVSQSVVGMGKVFGPDGVRRLFSILGGDKRALDDPVGVVGVSRLAGQAAAAGSLDGFFFLFMSLNIFVGVLNLVPLPPLDGGHVALLGLEKLRGGRPVDLQRVVPVMAVVAGFLVIYTVLLLYADIVNPIPNPFR